MKFIRIIRWAALGGLLVCSSASAATLEIHGAWIREAPPNASVLAAYMIISNTGTTDAQITDVASPDFEHAELHRTVVEGGIARMIRINSLEIPAGKALSLDPGGIHLMLIDPQRALHEGDSVTLTIRTGDGASTTLSVPVVRETGEMTHQHH